MVHHIKSVVTDISRFTTQNHIDFASEASSVGLPPGVWPDELNVRDGEREIHAVFSSSEKNVDELNYVLYNSSDGMSFKVYND